MLTAVSSLVVAVSSAMSATALTVTLTVAVSVDAARGHRVGEAVGAVEVGVRRVDDESSAVLPGVPLSLTATVPLRAVGGAGDRRRALERVVRQHLDVDRRVLVGGGGVVGDVGDRIDRHVDGRGLGHARPRSPCR